MVRVLQVLDNMNIGGMESMLMNYYRNIDKSKVQFDFLIFNHGKCFYEDEIKELGGRIYKITSRRKNPFKNRKEMVRFFSNNKYEIVEIHQGVTYLFPLRIAKKNKIKNIIVHNHGVDNKYKHGFLNFFRLKIAIPYIARTATVFFACSKSVLRDLFSEDIIDKHNYRIVNNAIDAKEYIFDKEIRRKIRNDLGIQDKYVIGHVGRFDYQKNQEFIIELAREMPENIFILIGAGDSTSYRNLMLKNVILYGECNNVNEVLQAFDVFVLPSRWEGLSLAAVEAQAAGLPVILSDTVSLETKITKNVVFLPLIVDDWLKAIKKMNGCSRGNTFESIKNGGYDCVDAAKRLEQVYLKMVREI